MTIIMNINNLKISRCSCSNKIKLTMIFMIAWEMDSSIMTLVVIIIIKQTILILYNRIPIANVLEYRHRRKRASHYHLHKDHHHH